MDIDLNHCVPQKLAVDTPYRALLEKVRSTETFTEREAEVLDYILRTRVRLITELKLLEEARTLAETLERILHIRHHHRLNNVAGVSYYERWQGYRMIIEDAISVIRDEREFGEEMKNSPVISIFNEFVQRSSSRMA